MTTPKRHHFVPDFYLRRFADPSGRITVRRRDGRSFTTSTTNVLAEVHGYRVPGRALTAESLLGRAETGASLALAEIDSTGRLPARSTEVRRELALYMALQYSRTPDLMATHEFVATVKAEHGPDQIPESWMSDYLDELHGFVPREPEVRAACSLANFAPDISDVESQEVRIKLLFETAVKQTGPHIDDGALYAFPAPGCLSKGLHPLLIWWAVLHPLSMLARYQPAEWAMWTDVNESEFAVPVERFLRTAIAKLPSLILEVIENLKA